MAPVGVPIRAMRCEHGEGCPVRNRYLLQQCGPGTLHRAQTKPGLCVGHRNEIVEVADLPGNRRIEDPRRTHRGTSKGPRNEDARRVGQIRGRSR